MRDINITYYVPFFALQSGWYIRRAGIALIYTAAGKHPSLLPFTAAENLMVPKKIESHANYTHTHTYLELHQLASPETTPAFLRGLLETSAKPTEAMNELALFADFSIRAWSGILRGRGFY